MKQEARQATETLEAMRFLWAMVGVTADVLELVDYRVGPGGEHFTCRNRGNGHVVAVSRQRRWTEEEERRYVDALDRALGGGDATDQVLPIERAIIEPDLVSPSDSQSEGLGQSPSLMELVAR